MEILKKKNALGIKMNFKFVSAGEKKKLIEELGKDFGIEKLNYLLIESGRERIRGFTGHMN